MALSSLPRIGPALLTSATEPFHRPGWVYEEKIDGFRAMLYRDGDDVALISRSGRDLTPRFRDLAQSLRTLAARRCVLDGEIAAFDKRLISHIDLLHPRPGVLATPPVFIAFDCLVAGRSNLQREALARRRAVLEDVVDGGDRAFAVARLVEDGRAAFISATARGLEGIVAKDSAAGYVAGRRASSWVKVKVVTESEAEIVAIVGRRHVSGLLVATGSADNESRVVSQVGFGLSAVLVRSLVEAAAGYVVSKPALGGIARTPDLLWLRPGLHARIRHHGTWRNGQLRDAVYRGLSEAAAQAARPRSEPQRRGASTAPPRDGSIRTKR